MTEGRETLKPVKQSANVIAATTSVMPRQLPIPAMRGVSTFNVKAPHLECVCHDPAEIR